MLSFDESANFLDEVADSLPEILFRDLNGGVSIVDYPKHKGNGMMVLGEYTRSREMGRYITIYFGSFRRVFSHLSDEDLKKKLKEVLVHELTHHNEALAGCRDLEIKDALQQQRYNETGEFIPTRDIKIRG